MTQSTAIYGTIWKRVRVAESTLAAHEAAVRWKATPPSAEFSAGTDPMTGAPFYTATMKGPHALETLVIAGGDSEIQVPRNSEKLRLAKLGLANQATFVIEVTRPAQENVSAPEEPAAPAPSTAPPGEDVIEVTPAP